MNGNGSYSSKLRECISNCTWNRVNWKWGQIIKSQYSPPMTYMLPPPRLYLLNFPYHSPSITTKWGPSVQILEPYGGHFSFKHHQLIVLQSIHLSSLFFEYWRWAKPFFCDKHLWYDTLPHHSFKAKAPNIHRLKHLKLWAKINL